MLRAMTLAVLLAAAFIGGAPGSAQTPLDRVDPSVIEDELRRPEKRGPEARPPLIVAQPRPDPSAPDQGIVAGAIRVDGATALPQSAFAPVIERYAGRLLSPSDLQALAGDVAGVARAAGYGLATAGIPQQRISNGILRVLLDEGRIDEVRAEGNAAAAVNRMLAPLADGTPVRTSRLERQLLIADDLPGVSLSRARIDRRDGRNILRLSADRRHSEGRFSLDNWGTRLSGPVRAHLSGDANGFLADDDQLTLSAVVTPFQPEEFGLIRAEYSKLLGRGGTEGIVRGYLARSQIGIGLDDLGGDSREGALALSHPFRRSRASFLRGELEFAVRDSTQDFRGIRLREDRLATLTVGAVLFGKFGGGSGRLRLAVVQGLDAFGATQRGDPLASRPDAGGTFTKIEAVGFYYQSLGHRFSFQAQAEGQAASRALLASEEMGLGGRYFIRSYDYRQRSGDHGIAGSVELRYDLHPRPGLIKSALVYGYADVGTVGNENGGFGGGSLASAGGGVRVRLGTIDAALELGIPVAGDPDAPRDPRLSFTLGTQF
jgi:hemolysin activation/secretion protein